MIRLKITVIALIAMLLPSSGLANELCGERNDLIQHFGAEYTEVLTARGLANNGIVWEVLTSPGGTWTIILTNPMGISCLIGAGEAWSKTPAAATASGGPVM